STGGAHRVAATAARHEPVDHGPGERHRLDEPLDPGRPGSGEDHLTQHEQSVVRPPHPGAAPGRMGRRLLSTVVAWTSTRTRGRPSTLSTRPCTTWRTWPPCSATGAGCPPRPASGTWPHCGGP